jgi:hypothetical protein
MIIDPEIEAISKCHELIKVLDNEAKMRVIKWLVDKFELTSDLQKGAFSSKTNNYEDVHPEELLLLPDKHKSNNSNSSIADFETVADFFSHVHPSTDHEKALVVAAYLQEKNRLDDLTGGEIQKELKHLGHGVANITTSIGVLEKKKPKLMIQTRKEGKSKQARKKYKVTMEGFNSVKEMMNSNEG